ncbi:MAG: inositol monophosphatase [Deltaproteobacteria bacterium]|nr:MAG: inositol monophosphatase [Deltaproteobacteria bacterium]
MLDTTRIHLAAMGAAYQAAQIIRGYLGKLPRVDKKGAIDLVTDADKASEAAIIDAIRWRFPDHSFLAEESGATPGDERYVWIIDPLDGTTNFTHQLNAFSISIALAAEGQLIYGTVLDPVSGELFEAFAGQGATLNGQSISVTSTTNLEECLLVTGFPYNLKDHIRPLMQRFENCLLAAQGVRRLGSAALDLCYVACGRFDGFWEQHLKPWDTAAGTVIAREAGARVTDFSGNPFQVEMPELLATNGPIHSAMQALLALDT